MILSTTVKKRAAFLALAFAACLAAAQAAPAPGAMKAEAGEAERLFLHTLNLDPKELDRIEKVLAKDEETLSKARAEIRIIQARLARLMLEADPPMDQAKALVKESLDWEFQIRMIQLQRQVEIHKILGDDRWAGLFQLGMLLFGQDVAPLV